MRSTWPLAGAAGHVRDARSFVRSSRIHVRRGEPLDDGPRQRQPEVMDPCTRDKPAALLLLRTLRSGTHVRPAAAHKPRSKAEHAPSRAHGVEDAQVERAIALMRASL